MGLFGVVTAGDVVVAGVEHDGAGAVLEDEGVEEVDGVADRRAAEAAVEGV